MSGLTLDTGALIALERRRKRALGLVAEARLRGELITVPSPVVVEWWRGQQGAAAGLLAAFDVELLDEPLARVAGLALGHVGKGPSATDAVVMASAARRGDIVLTGDVDDLGALQAVFPGVRILRV